MKLYVVVLILLVVLALSAICKAGKGRKLALPAKSPTNQHGDTSYWDNTHYDDNRLIQPHHESSEADSWTALQEAIAEQPAHMSTNEPNLQSTESFDSFAQSPVYPPGFYPPADDFYPPGFHPPADDFYPPGFHPPVDDFYPPGFNPPVDDFYPPGFHPPADDFYPPGFHPPADDFYPPGFNPPVDDFYPPGFHPPVDDFYPPGFHPPADDFYPPGFHPPADDFYPPGFNPPAEFNQQCNDSIDLSASSTKSSGRKPKSRKKN